MTRNCTTCGRSKDCRLEQSTSRLCTGYEPPQPSMQTEAWARKCGGCRKWMIKAQCPRERAGGYCTSGTLACDEWAVSASQVAIEKARTK
jgi:hypothetical protein